jgi:hypothetical protein
VQSDRAFGGVQGDGDIGRAIFYRDTRQPNGLIGCLQLGRGRVGHSHTLQCDARAGQAVARVQAQRLDLSGFAPMDQAGQGGYGIQTAPAMVELASALVQGLPVPAALAAVGVRVEDVSPLRPGLGATP